MASGRKRLGDVLIESGVLYPHQLEKALEKQSSSAAGPGKGPRKRLGKILIEMGFLTETHIAQALATQLGITMVSLKDRVIPENALKLVPREIAEQEVLIPYALVEGKKLTVVMSDPLAWTTIDDLRFRTGLEIESLLSTESEIFMAIEKNYKVEEATETLLKLGPEFEDVQFLDETEEGVEESAAQTAAALSQAAPIIRLVTMTIVDAITKRASDIHVEPQEHHVHIRYRIDGDLRDIFKLPRRVLSSVVSRLKILAKMDIANRMTPQDGGTKLVHEGKEYDLRISTLPAVYGEKVVLRILDRSSGLVPLEKLGVSPKITNQLKETASKSQGMILVTGPTGSGKTTTLYALLQWLQNPALNIVTVEDPVEYKLAGITQVAINERAGLGFPAFLKSAMRQDPDVILVGEIRDIETAEMAIRAALTGHLVLSTLHTNDSVATVYRLIDLGVQSFLISTSLAGILAQRLVRKICPSCKEEISIPPESLPKSVKPLQTYYQGKGCSSCQFSGYMGQVGVYEFLSVSTKIRRMIAKETQETELRHQATEEGLISMFDNAWQKVAEGVTTVSEVFGRVPLYAAESETPVVLPTGGKSAYVQAAKSHNIVVWSPDPEDAARLKSVLPGDAYQVIAVPKGTDPYESVARNHPDLILLDATPPETEALGLIEKIKENLSTATIPIIAVTDGKNKQLVIAREIACLQLGANDFLRRPLNDLVLRSKVEKALNMNY